jgi:hypothetical protein
VDAQSIGETAEEKSGREKRKCRRLACEGSAECFAFDTGTLFRGSIQDISLTGCYVTTKARLRLTRLSEVDLCFTLKGRQYHIIARVMVVRPGDGVGFEFMFDDPRGSEWLKEELMALFEEAITEEA